MKAPYRGTSSQLWKGLQEEEPVIEDYIFWQLVHQSAVTEAERVRLLVYITDDVYWTDEWDGDELRQYWPELFEQWQLFYAGQDQPDPTQRTDREWHEAAKTFVAAAKQYEQAKALMDAAKQRMIRLSQQGDGQPRLGEDLNKVRGGGVTVRRAERKGSIDYAKIPAVKEMTPEELDLYRRKPSVVYTVEAK